VPQLRIDNQPVDFTDGQTIQQAAAAAGIRIPTLCHHPDLSDVGSCRVCLVEVDGSEHLVPACKQRAMADTAIQTHPPQVVAARRMVLRLLTAQGGFAAPAEHAKETELDRLLHEYQVEPAHDQPSRYPVDSDPSPFLHVDLNQCILCTRCIRACDEVQGRFVWGLADRGHESHIEPGAGVTLQDARCEGCGACAAYCPTGAISDRGAIGLRAPDRQVTTTCAYCGVGCQFDLNVIDDRVVRVTSNSDAPVNGMHLCVKGRYGFDYVHHPERLTRPRVRRELLDRYHEGVAEVVRLQPSAGILTNSATRTLRGEWVDVDWNTALDLVARQLVGIHAESGPRALGFLSSAKCTNEENYLIQKIARQIFGTNNVDHCARLCHSSTVAGLGMAIGSGAMSNSLDDVADHAAAFFVIGSNTTEQHPVFGSMLRQAVLRRGAKLIVADPRKIDLVEFATLHLRHRPGTDIALLNGIMHLILKNGWEDREFIASRCENFEVVAESLQDWTPLRASEITGVAVCDLEEAARILGTHKPAAVVWAMGITQHITGVMNVLALANLQMMLGNFGVPGGGVNPLRGQNNVQGACDMGALPNVLPGYQPVGDVVVRERYARGWSTITLHEESMYDRQSCLSHAPRDDVFLDDRGAGKIAYPTSYDHSQDIFPAEAGLTLTEMISRAGTGDLRGLWITGENPVLTDPNSAHVRDCIAKAEFVVLHEIFPSATSEFADVLLPGTSFAERDGTFANTERRVQLVRQAIPPVGEARPEWQMLAELGRRCLALQQRTPVGEWAGYDYSSPTAIMEEIRHLTPIYGGITYERLERGDRLQWPVKDLQSPGTPILHQGTFTRGKGRFHPTEYLAPHELPDEAYPLLLTTGRVLYHWHAGEMTHRSHGLEAACPLPVVEISATDAERLGIADGDTIQLESRRGTMTASAWITDRVAEGVVFANFHFHNPSNANELTQSTPLDPVAKIPEYKVTAVRVSKP
jgi:predicted molibdopterin-dependent oxidoreductase YjgC